MWIVCGLISAFFSGGRGGEGKKGKDKGKKQEIEVRELFCFGIREYFLTELLIVYRSAWRFSEMSDSVVR